MEEYRLDLQLKAAINGIENTALLPLSKEVIEKWLSAHYETWEIMEWQIAYNPSLYFKGDLISRFESIWDHLDKIRGYFELEAKCEAAIEEYESILAENTDIKSNFFQVCWLLKYEKLGREDLILPPIEENEVNNVKEINRVCYVVLGKNFKKSMEFYKLFNRLFWEEQILSFRIAEIRMQRLAEEKKLKGNN